MQDEMKEIPEGLIENAGNPEKSSNITKNILLEFLKKLVIYVVTSIPFYFFKICIPPGPLTFSCCPEAMFFPTQLYNLFSMKEKVEKFKLVAKNYPEWLEQSGNAHFNKVRYYICAQSYLTAHESALFNMCNPLTMIWILPPVFTGQVNGDFPYCFWSCLQVNLYIISTYLKFNK